MGGDNDAVTVATDRDDDEENARAATKSMVQISPPRDLTGEAMTFPVAPRDGAQQPSVKGIVEYGAAARNDGRGGAVPVGCRGDGGDDRRHSSLQSRKSLIPDSVLLHDRDAIEDDIHRRSSLGASVQVGGGCFQRFFLNPSYSLQRQMLLTFGSISSLTILVVMGVSIIASVATGNAIREESTANVELWVEEFMSSTTRFSAEALSQKVMPNNLVEIMVEVASDRFAGYPTTSDDSLTPFFDILSGTNVYPLKNDPLPLEWDFRHTSNEGGNVNGNNFAEHVQHRWEWYKYNWRLSTMSAAFAMQGTCDPRATDPDVMEYYPNCTDANNDVATGGVVAPNPTNAQVYRKAADLSPFLKALHETHQDMKNVGYYFSNSGAGATTFFPHYEFDSSSSYISIGCEWMRADNPINASLGPIGTDEQIARCHPEGVVVPTREYNPLERAWCRDQALNPDRLHITGPYVDAWSGEWLMTNGRAVYDLVTNAFVCCIAVDINIHGVNKVLQEVKVDDFLGTMTLVRNDYNGTVVSSPSFDFENASSPTAIDDPKLETGITTDMFDQIRTLEKNTFESEDYFISVHPMPPKPDEDDPAYMPQFFVLFSVPRTTPIFLIANETSQNVNERVWNLVLFALIAGAIGIVVGLLLIFASASLFVKPLKWMGDIGDQVVGKFGEDLDSYIDHERKKPPQCTPKTELSSLVEEFNTMVARFSGEGTATRMKMTDHERHVNLFDFSKEFDGLYRSREDKDLAFNYPETCDTSGATKGQPKSLDKSHLDQNSQTLPETSPQSSLFHEHVHSGKVHRSPLFYWMAGLIITPILLFTVIISSVVLSEISTGLASLTVPVQQEYSSLRDSYRSTKTHLLAISASEVLERAARDTHLLKRFASWLYFGGMGMKGSFTELYQGGAEECKTTPPDSTCSWTKGFPCDCAWNDFYARGTDTCRDYPKEYPLSSRRQQKLYFEGLSEDAGQDGSRNSTSYPDVADSPATTDWWDNISALPGSTDEEFTSSNYATTYARVKTYSALSTIMIPLYNYDKSDDKPLASFVGFEADGMFAGYSGCWYHFTNYSYWRSSEDNGAFEISPHLCPLGKYGFDSRCRGWYADGKRKSLNGTEFHITAPYIFAGKTITGQSTTSPLIDPRNGEHIGQVIVDFLPDPIFRSLESDDTKLAAGRGYPIMITPEKDILGHDTLVAPGFSLENGPTRAIEELLQVDDDFQPILKDMKAGKKGKGVFHIQNKSERLNISYAPVVVSSYRPLNSSDIASGVEQQNTTVYSLAFIDSDAAPINEFSSEVNICIGVLSALVVISTVLIIYVAFLLTTSMTEPIIQLLDVIKGINSMRMSNDINELTTNYKGSCHEVDVVYKTMEMLYKVVQFANCAFFSGSLDVAYQVLRDALCLFTRLDNKKAIAVASNNLGNTMLTIYRSMKASDSEEMCGLTKREVIAKGSAYYALSIKLGESAYDQFYNEQGWSEECLVFMQFLANRYFNRAIFFLTSSADNENRKEAEALGFRDLQITADMDVEIVDQCLEMGFKIDRVERYELMMSRVRGLNSLVEVGYSPNELFIEDQINNIYQDLINAMKNPSHELFKEISVAGRMQKLDFELIKYFRHAKNDNVNAARVAIRMLIEDEYVFPDAEEEAIKMLLIYMSKTEDENCPKDETGDIVKELESGVESLERAHIQRVRQNRSNVSLSITEKGENYTMPAEKLTEEEKARESIASRQSALGDIVMELF